MQAVRLSKEEEAELVARCRAGEEDAKDRLLKVYFPFVASLAKKYKNYFPRIEFEELLEEGNLGLLEALEHYDSSRQVKFSSYAWFWIVRSIQDYITETLAFMKIPAGVASNLKKITKMIESGLAENRDITIEDITSGMDLELEKVKELLVNQASMSAPVSLDSYIDGDDQKNTLKDVVDSGEKNSEDTLEGIEKDEKLEKYLSCLGEHEAEVIKWRFGFNDYKYHTLKDIAEKLGIAPQKVRDIETIAIAKLKIMMKEGA